MYIYIYCKKVGNKGKNAGNQGGNLSIALGPTKNFNKNDSF